MRKDQSKPTKNHRDYKVSLNISLPLSIVEKLREESGYKGNISQTATQIFQNYFELEGSK